MNQKKRKIFTTAISLLLGIAVGYALLLAFFGGISASGNTILPAVGMLFLMSFVAVAPLLWRQLKSPKN